MKRPGPRPREWSVRRSRKCHLTCDRESPFPKPQAMFEVELGEDRDAWADQVKRHILAMRPDLECVHTLKPRSAARGRPPAFDLAFRPKDSEGPKGPHAKAKGTK